MKDTRSFFSQGWPVKAALWVGRFLPLWGARPAAAVGAWLIMFFKPDMYHGARANLRHVLGEGLSEKELRQTLRRLFTNTVRRYYEFFYNMGRGYTRVSDFTPPVVLSEATQAHIRQILESSHGLFIIACHMANFDLAGIAMSQAVTPAPQTLSLAAPTADIEVFNQLRERCGAFLTPITPQALRDAIERLKCGGSVATGADYPVPEESGEPPVTFFGAPANLPSGYMRIPLLTDSLVLVLTTHYEDGMYRIYTAPPMEMIRTGDRKQDIAVNLRRVLDQVETFIRQHPDEWMMFVPVWSEP
ncbi:MAG: hypothetical protein JXA21_16035 [Anaerolineae bacterium]|nr:hypothetical protein [Anaerolineae bacterium]